MQKIKTIKKFYTPKENIMKKFYITTPIYYPSNKLTLGNCYTTVVCDAIARFHRNLGDDVFFLTGTDEHGQKIEKIANEKGLKEIDYLNEIVADTKKLWEELNISYDKFIRTTDSYHEKTASKIFDMLYEKGEIYKSEYKGKYCVPCESFWTDEQLVDGKCPDCGRDVIEANEESYFFKLSKYENALRELYKNNPEFLQPVSRANEMINNFFNTGLKDLCVSRKTVKWGIPVSFDKEQTIYVWIDALSNYLSALGFLSDDDQNFKKFWPADVHVVGKEIVRFHAIIWPAILMALDIPLPKQIFGHGWLTFNNGKLSKSKAVDKKEVIDPRILDTRYTSDSVRNFLIGEISFGQDGPYSQEGFLNSYNGILANKVGNIASRLTGMVIKYNGGIIENGENYQEIDTEFKSNILKLKNECINNMLELKPTLSYKSALKIIDECNLYIDNNKPWELAKDEANKSRINTILYNAIQSMLEAYALLNAFLPQSTSKILKIFNINNVKIIAEEIFNFDINGKVLEKGEPLFARLDIAKELAELNEIANS